MEIAHHQGTQPDLVTVQVQQNGSEWLSDGIGIYHQKACCLKLV